MNAFSFEGAKVSGHRRHKRLTFTGLHFGDVSTVERSSTHNLHVKWTQAQHAPSCFTYRREGFNHELIKSFTIGNPLPELVGFPAKLIIR